MDYIDSYINTTYQDILINQGYNDGVINMRKVNISNVSLPLDVIPYYDAYFDDFLNETFFDWSKPYGDPLYSVIKFCRFEGHFGNVLSVAKFDRSYIAMNATRVI